MYEKKTYPNFKTDLKPIKYNKANNLQWDLVSIQMPNPNRVLIFMYGVLSARAFHVLINRFQSHQIG